MRARFTNKRVAEGALLARHPDRRAGQAVARGRGDRGAAAFGKFVQNFRDKVVQPQRAFLLRVPPAARENHRQAFRRGAGGVFQFDQISSPATISSDLAGGKKILREIIPHLRLRHQRQALETIEIRALQSARTTNRGKAALRASAEGVLPIARISFRGWFLASLTWQHNTLSPADFYCATFRADGILAANHRAFTNSNFSRRRLVRFFPAEFPKWLARGFHREAACNGGRPRKLCCRNTRRRK